MRGGRILGIPLVGVLQGDLHPDGRGFTWWLPPRPAPSPAGAFNAALARAGLPPVDKAARLLLGGAAVVVGSPATDPVPDPALPMSECWPGATRRQSCRGAEAQSSIMALA